MARDTTERAREIRATNLTGEDRAWLEGHTAGLSDSTLRARWVSRPDEGAERDGQTLATRSGEVIKAWAAARGGVAATATRGPEGRPRTLRIDFQGEGGGGRSRRLEQISWDDWLAVFHERDLVFLFQDRLRNGNQSTFFRLDSPEREDG